MGRPRKLLGGIFRKEGAPTLWIWWWDPDGRRRRKPTSSADTAVAERELYDLLARLERGEEAVPPSGGLTLAAWSERWLAARRDADKGEVENERGHLEHHILPELGRIRLKDLSTARVLEWLQRLPRHTAAGTTDRISGTTARKIAGTLRLLLRDAAKRRLIQASPCDWDNADLPSLGVPDVGVGFTEAEMQLLISDARVPADRQVLYALEFLTGMRTGEAAARRWRDWDQKMSPLTGLRVGSTWNTKKRAELPTKTKVRRTIPVHPVLERVLRAWLATGWAAFQGREPGPDDLMVPAEDGGPRRNTSSWRAFQRDLRELGLDPQRHYESRASFASAAEGGGADSASIAILTHPSPRTAKDLYRRLRLLWPQLCRAVLCIHLELDEAPTRAA